MKIKLFLLICLCFSLLTNSVFAQSKIKKDTIYYLLDTLKIPVNDRIVTSQKMGNATFTEIKCPCVNRNDHPWFYSPDSKKKIFSKDKFRSIKLINLVSLIEIVKNSGDNFNKKYSFFIIEPMNNEYIVRETFFDGRETTVAIDSVTTKN
jgi:hypothetical protein